MPDFLVRVNANDDKLHVHAQRTDGQVREFSFPLKFLKLMNLTQEILDYLLGRSGVV